MKKTTFNQIVASLATIAWGTVPVYFYARGLIDRYLNESFHLIALIGGLAMMVLGLFNLLHANRQVGCGHDHSHEHGENDDHEPDHAHHEQRPRRQRRRHGDGGCAAEDPPGLGRMRPSGPAAMATDEQLLNSAHTPIPSRPRTKISRERRMCRQMNEMNVQTDE